MFYDIQTEMTKLLSQEIVKLCFLYVVIKNSNTKASSWAARMTLTTKIRSDYTDLGRSNLSTWMSAMEYQPYCLAYSLKTMNLGIFMLPGAVKPF